ncbi:hypothetical protein [uncultured Planktomarina sp.]|uniref:hypothetical protein n=1 Tax=uncultured Planktomarina sp. TaxID=1538529 RepID=UPI003260C01C
MAIDDDKKFTQADIDAAIKKVTDAHEDATKGLKAKVDELLTESKDAKAAKKAAEDKAAEDARKAAAAGGDVEAITKSFEDKIAKMETDHQAELASANGALRTATVEAQATAMAAEIAVPGSERHVRRDILDRMASDVVEGKVKISVLDKDGKPSAMTPDELKAEIAGDPANKSLIRATDASGGGAAGQNGGAGGFKRSEMSSKDKADYIEKHGQEAYLKLSKD